MAGHSANNGKEAMVDDMNKDDINMDKTAEAVERDDAAAFYHSICPITDKDERPFRLMELPTEIRLVRGVLETKFIATVANAQA